MRTVKQFWQHLSQFISLDLPNFKHKLNWNVRFCSMCRFSQPWPRIAQPKMKILAFNQLSVFFPYYGSQWPPSTFWLSTFFKISSFVFNRRQKLIQVWNSLRVIKCHHFWVNYPFKKSTSPQKQIRKSIFQ